MERTKIIIMAPAGRMDRLIVKAAAAEPALQIVGGVGTPGRNYIGKDIALAAGKHQVDILALSFSQSYDGNPLDTLESLRSLLPDRVTLWVGGAGCQTIKTSTGRWQVLRSLNDLEPLLHDWRHTHLT